MSKLAQLRTYWRSTLWSHGLPAHIQINLVVGWPLPLLPFLLFSQVVTPHPVWVVLLVVLVSLYVAAYLWMREQAPAVDFDRRRQGMVLVAGDLLHEEFTLANRSRLPIMWAEFHDASDLPHYAPGSVVSAPVGGAYRWSKQVECAQRGVFRLGPHWLRLGDPFGLFEAVLTYDRSETLLIYPRVVQLPPVNLPRGSAGGVAAMRRPLLGVLPATSVREYAQGDSMRHVHWPSTARRGHMMVKELELEPTGDVWIVPNLDAAVQRGAGRSGTLETTIMLAASMAAEMVSGRERRAVGLLAASADSVVAIPPQPGPAQLWAIMAALAPARATTWSLADLLRRNLRGLGRRHTLIVLTPPAYGGQDDAAAAAPDWGGELVQAQRVGLASSVLLVTQPEDEGAATEIVRRLASLDIPAQIVRTDMPLRAALTYRRKRKVIRSTPTGGAYTIEVEEEVG